MLTYHRPTNPQPTTILTNRLRHHVAGSTWLEETGNDTRGLQPATPLYWAGEVNFCTISRYSIRQSHETTSKPTVGVGASLVVVGVRLIVYCVWGVLVKGIAHRDKQRTHHADGRCFPTIQMAATRGIVHDHRC
jgi:hypothetical protein